MKTRKPRYRAIRGHRPRRVTPVLLAMILLTGAASVSALTTAEAGALLAQLDRQSNMEGSDFAAQMTMVQTDPEEGTERTKVQQFRRDADDAFLMLIQEPVVQRGQGYLRVDDNLWFYDPESRTFSHTSMNDRFNGSDANNSDFRQSTLSEDYRVTGVDEGTLGSYDVYILDLEAVNDEVTYPTRRIWVSRETPIILKSQDYSAGGRLLRTSYYPSYSQVRDDAYVPTRMIFVDELVEGKQTEITLTDISVRELPDSIFTKSYVERVND